MIYDYNENVQTGSILFHPCAYIDKIREELADVLNYCILMADTCGLDMDEIIQEKVRKNNEKYPVEKAYGSKEKYTE